MPYTQQQRKVARAVQHGWKPKGSAKGFTHEFAEQVIEESGDRVVERKGKRRGRNLAQIARGE